MDICQSNYRPSQVVVALFALSLAPLALAQEEPATTEVTPSDGFFGGLIDSITAQVGDWAISALEALICWTLEKLGPLIDQILNLLPESMTDIIGTLYQYLAMVEHWIPISYGLGLLLLYLTFAAIQLPIKLIIKLIIPTVG